MPGKVMVSVGHYSDENTREIEYPANLRVGQLLHSFLINNGFLCEIIEGGQLRDKVRSINIYNPDIAVECHFNRLSYPHDPKKYGSGYEVCIWQGSRSGRRLAGEILHQWKKRLPFKRRGTGVWERTDLYFLKKTYCPSIILEPLFLDNATETTFLDMEHGYAFIAEATYLGIVGYFKERESLASILQTPNT